MPAVLTPPAGCVRESAKKEARAKHVERLQEMWQICGVEKNDWIALAKKYGPSKCRSWWQAVARTSVLDGTLCMIHLGFT